MKDNGEPFETLVARARDAYEAENEKSETYWEVVWLLANRGDQETLEKVLPLTSGDETERSFAASVLGPFAPRIDFEPFEVIEVPRRFASTEITDVLLEMLEREKDERVIEALVAALGQHRDHDPRIPPAISRFYQHPNNDIRWALAVGLGGYDTPEAVATLLVLSADRDATVRDWATFGLARQIGADSPEVRAALAIRLNDKDAEIRLKAIEGLALRHDPHVVEAFLHEFEDASEWERLFLPAERLLIALQEMAANPDFQGDHKRAQAALALCEEILNYFAAPVGHFPASSTQNRTP